MGTQSKASSLVAWQQTSQRRMITQRLIQLRGYKDDKPVCKRPFLWTAAASKGFSFFTSFFVATRKISTLGAILTTRAHGNKFVSRGKISNTTDSLDAKFSPNFSADERKISAVFSCAPGFRRKGTCRF